MVLCVTNCGINTVSYNKDLFDLTDLSLKLEFMTYISVTVFSHHFAVSIVELFTAIKNTY